MTEDDTYLKLVRPSAKEMYYLLKQLHVSKEYNSSTDSARLSMELLAKNNWDYEEYCSILEKSQYDVSKM